MKLHANAALCLNRRRRLARRIGEQGWSPSKAAGTHEVSQPTARKWARRYRAEGEAGLLDRPSAANRVWNRTPDDRVEAIRALRRLRFTSAEIAELLEMPETTVSGILTRVGLGRLGRMGLEPPRATSARWLLRVYAPEGVHLRPFHGHGIQSSRDLLGCVAGALSLRLGRGGEREVESLSEGLPLLEHLVHLVHIPQPQGRRTTGETAARHLPRSTKQR